jgi:hypothetical protein
MSLKGGGLSIILLDKKGDFVSNSDRRHRDFSSGRWIPGQVGTSAKLQEMLTRMLQLFFARKDCKKGGRCSLALAQQMVCETCWQLQ